VIFDKPKEGERIETLERFYELCSQGGIVVKCALQGPLYSRHLFVIYEDGLFYHMSYVDDFKEEGKKEELFEGSLYHEMLEKGHMFLDEWNVIGFGET